MQVERPQELILPEVNSENAMKGVSNSTGIRVHLYGMKTWGSLFNQRQLATIQTFVASLHEALEAMEQDLSDKDYRLALGLYLGLWLDRVAVFNNSVTRWRSSHQKSETPFGGQAIPMIWDYPEVNPLADSSGTASTQLRYMLKVIEHERMAGGLDIAVPDVLQGNAASLPLGSGIANCVVTDPPYDDAIAYGDLSDFFYVWLKRSVGPLFPEAFATPLTPKADEATSLKHRHDGCQELARAHYRRSSEGELQRGAAPCRRAPIGDCYVRAPVHRCLDSANFCPLRGGPFSRRDLADRYGDAEDGPGVGDRFP